MFWRATSVGLAGLWAMAASAQTLPRLIVKPGAPIEYTETGRALRELVKNYRPDMSSVCSIPLTEVPVAKGVVRMDRMPILRPRKQVEPMPFVPLPAPPCQEEKR